MEDLLRAIENSDPEGAAAAFDRAMAQGTPPWCIHLDLFPVAQGVANPPFINPHLPKMHAICREFVPFLTEEDLPALVRLEVREYARRPKLGIVPARQPKTPPVPFTAVGAAVKDGDRRAAEVAMAGFVSGQGHKGLARRMALLGSGYMARTLGHSLSCSVFILQEMIERAECDSSPAFTALADYYVKGRFEETPGLDSAQSPASEDALRTQLLRAVSGSGVVDLHHTINLYAAARARPWCTDPEAHHLMGAAVAFMGDKKARTVPFPAGGTPLTDYIAFRTAFGRLDAAGFVADVSPMLDSEGGRRNLARFLIKAVCDAYQGDYDPHFLTGLGSLLWVLDRFRDRRDIQLNALFQYASYFFHGLQARR